VATTSTQAATRLLKAALSEGVTAAATAASADGSLAAISQLARAKQLQLGAELLRAATNLVLALTSAGTMPLAAFSDPVDGVPAPAAAAAAAAAAAPHVEAGAWPEGQGSYAAHAAEVGGHAASQGLPVELDWSCDQAVAAGQAAAAYDACLVSSARGLSGCSSGRPRPAGDATAAPASRLHRLLQCNCVSTRMQLGGGPATWLHAGGCDARGAT
jgi:hypothetical protein